MGKSKILINQLCSKCQGERGWIVHGYGVMPDWIVCDKCKGTGNAKLTVIANEYQAHGMKSTARQIRIKHHL